MRERERENIFVFFRQAVSTPVRLQSLKLMGRLTFNTGSLVFPHLERVTATLVSVMEETEGQVVLHACRVLEIMSGCLANTEVYHGDGALFWNIIFESTISLAQTSQTILREAACDCLGSISGNVFTQLSVRVGETRERERKRKSVCMRVYIIKEDGRI